MTDMAWTAAPGTHAARFCDDEDAQHDAIAKFLAEGLEQNRPALMISRRPAFEAVADLLQIRTDDPVSPLVFVDVDSALAGFMNGAVPDLVRFEQNAVTLVADVHRRHGDGPIWIYGGMAGALHAAGNQAAAILIERHWNARFSGPGFALLCGYHLGGVPDDPQPLAFQAICQEHATVLPSYGGAGRSTVYVVEDDTSVRRSLARLIKSLGMRVDTFASAEAFLALVDRTTPGCVILDAQLMGMNGSDLQVRMGQEGWSLPIIAMSASLDAVVEEQSMRLGARTFLRKPFPAEALTDAIARALADG